MFMNMITIMITMTMMTYLLCRPSTPVPFLSRIAEVAEVVAGDGQAEPEEEQEEEHPRAAAPQVMLFAGIGPPAPSRRPPEFPMPAAAGGGRAMQSQLFFPACVSPRFGVASLPALVHLGG